MLVGSGSIALRRDVLFATGVRCWFGGLPFPTLATEFAKRYDGTNEEEVRRWYYSISGPARRATNASSPIASEVVRPTRR